VKKLDFYGKMDYIYAWAKSNGMAADNGRVFPFDKPDEYSSDWHSGIDLMNIQPENYLSYIMKTLFERGQAVGRNEIRTSFKNLMEEEEVY